MNLPVRGNYSVTATYGQSGKYWKDGHKGIDFVSDDSTVYSTCRGRVRVIAYDGAGWGNYLSVGDEGNMRHIYCHLKSIAVKVGQTVEVGTPLGVMGRSGNATGVHLHYQVNTAAGVAVDPSGYLDAGGESMYKDDDSIAPWAKEAVYAAKEKGYLVGDADGKFRPTEPLTRQEAAVMIMKLERK